VFDGEITTWTAAQRPQSLRPGKSAAGSTSTHRRSPSRRLVTPPIAFGTGVPLPTRGHAAHALRHPEGVADQDKGLATASR